MADTYAFTVVGNFVGVKKNTDGQQSINGRFFYFKTYSGGFRVVGYMSGAPSIDYNVLTADTLTLDGTPVTGSDQVRADALKAAFPA